MIDADKENYRQYAQRKSTEYLRQIMAFAYGFSFDKKPLTDARKGDAARIDI
jgi:hypothetical protein